MVTAALSDGVWMARAARLGHRALGATAENPPVGCVIVNGSRLVGAGRTAAGGRPHAETVALAMAGPAARAATAYVTLEPCAHHGRTPPCAEALIAAGIARVVVACDDPDPRVSGAGLDMLRRAGVIVDRLPSPEAAHDLAGFFSRIVSKRPYVILKLAVSADGAIATRAGERTAITGPEVKARVHLLRAQSDAIMVGRRTIEVDDPELTCRLPGLEGRSPIRVVLLGRGSLPSQAIVLATAAETPTWFFSSTNIETKHQLESISGVSALTANDLPAVLAGLASRGINRLLVEGGAKVAESFLGLGLVDEAWIFNSPKILGPEGVKVPLGLLSALNPVARETLGADTLTVYQRA